jgi:hypothetical protein
MPVAVGEEHEKRDLVAGDTLESGIDAESGAKGLPESPCGMRGAGALRRAAGMHRRLNSAPVSAELMEGVRCCSCQDVFCG